MRNSPIIPPSQQRPNHFSVQRQHALNHRTPITGNRMQQCVVNQMACKPPLLIPRHPQANLLSPTPAANRPSPFSAASRNDLRRSPAAPRPVTAQMMSKPGTLGSGNPAGGVTKYQFANPIHLGEGRQQIRMTVKGSRTLAGSVEVSPGNDGKMFISDLKVEREHRRHGLGTQLVSAALAAARNRGFRAANLEARPFETGISSGALVSMYQKMGFRSVGRSRRGSPMMERRL